MSPRCTGPRWSRPTRCATSRSRSTRASSSRSPAHRAPARRRSSTSPGCSRSSPAVSTLLDGVDVKQLDDRARSRLRNEKLGFVFQSFNLIPDLNLFDNVDVPLRYRGFARADRKKRIETALERVGLASRIRHLPAELSGGQQQRVAIARVIAGDPKLLVADEPTGNLDSQMAREVMQLLESLNAQGTVVVIVTHDPEIAARAQRNVHIVDGVASDLERGPSLVRHP